MKKNNRKDIKQTMFKKRGPNTGNCLQCALAYTLNVDISKVPHFARDYKKNEWWPALIEWLDGLDYVVHRIGYTDWVNIKTFYIVNGSSPRDEKMNHSVVYFGNKMIYDPHPSDLGIVTPKEMWILIKKL